MMISQKTMDEHTSGTCITSFGHKHKVGTFTPKAHLLNYVYSNIVHNSKILETTLMFLSQRKDKKNVQFTVEFVSVLRKNDIQTLAEKWTELEKTILSEITKTPKDKYKMYSFISGHKANDSQSTIHNPRECSTLFQK